ncbi:mitochondrial import inner membrane translocase subunit TIM50-like [Melia azedarach]|uniref:Mitochondrial import inner membrane translocase subunit TIM50-like n=1 Tax=Melia azedarach TaxID=155640 RepID=A0ACC1YQ44_MELAZ|nr:mitochondrial import inner membrane translocase subunit TIM50-like [Melia azedarach]
MSSNIVRSRIVPNLSKIYKKYNNNCGRRDFSSDVVSGAPKKEPIIASQSIVGDLTAPPEVAAEEAASQDAGRKSPWRFLKYGIVATLTGVTAGAGYVTYAYSSDEIEEKTKALRESVNYTAGDQNYPGLLYSTVLNVPAKATELYLDLRRLVEEQVRGFTEPTSDKLLPDLHPAEQHVFTLVLDLNETLLYSDWKRDRGWRTFKRPGVDAFLEHMAKFYEIVVYSDQLNMYVDPDGKHYRDLSKLNRDPAKILYVSGHAFESSLQPENSVPIKPYKLESDDTALLDLIPFLEYVARNSPADIRTVLASYEKKDIAKEFLERSKDYQRRMQEQRQHSRFWRL